MRKVVLTLKEKEKYDVIKKLVETNGNKKRAANKLKITERQINPHMLYLSNKKIKLKICTIQNYSLLTIHHSLFTALC